VAGGRGARAPDDEHFCQPRGEGGVADVREHVRRVAAGGLWEMGDGGGGAGGQGQGLSRSARGSWVWCSGVHM
jgi:hypothetical protein